MSWREGDHLKTLGGAGAEHATVRPHTKGAVFLTKGWVTLNMTHDLPAGAAALKHVKSSGEATASLQTKGVVLLMKQWRLSRHGTLSHLLKVGEYHKTFGGADKEYTIARPYTKGTSLLTIDPPANATTLKNTWGEQERPRRHYKLRASPS